MAEPAGYQPRSMFSQMLQQRQQEQTQKLVARTLNEEIERGVGGATNVNLETVLPQAYYDAAKRLADLGNITEAQQLYQTGLEAQIKLEEHSANLAKLRAAPAQPGANDAAIARLNRIEQERIDAKLPPWTAERKERFLSEFGQNSAESQRERMGDTRGEGYRDRTLDYNVEDTANRVAATQAIETLPAARVTATAGATGIEAIRGAVDMLNEGVRTGTSANIRQWFARAMATLAGQPVDEQKIVDNTDAYLGAISPLVFARVTALRPVTQEERSYVEQMAGGDISLTEGSLRKLLEIAYKANQRDIQAYESSRSFLSGNETYGRAIAGAFAPVEAPKPVDFKRPEVVPTFATQEEAAAAAAAGTLTPGTRIKIGNQTGVWR